MSKKQVAALVAWIVLTVCTAPLVSAETTGSQDSLLSDSDWVMGLSETESAFGDELWVIGSIWDGIESFGDLGNSAETRQGQPETRGPATDPAQQPYLAGVHSPAFLLLQIEHMPGPALLLFLSLSAALVIAGPVSKKRQRSE